jgi:hypothetical protein
MNTSPPRISREARRVMERKSEMNEVAIDQIVPEIVGGLVDPNESTGDRLNEEKLARCRQLYESLPGYAQTFVDSHKSAIRRNGRFTCSGCDADEVERFLNDVLLLVSRCFADARSVDKGEAGRYTKGSGV